MKIKFALIILLLVSRIAIAGEYRYPTLKKAIAQTESGNGKYYRYEPKFYRKYLKGNPKFKKLIVKYGVRNISASHGKYHIMYSTAYEHGFRGSPKKLKENEIQEQLFDKIFARLLRKTEGDYDKAVMYWNTGSRVNLTYLRRVKRHYKEEVQSENDKKVVINAISTMFTGHSYISK